MSHRSRRRKLAAGKKLQQVRASRGLTLRDVQASAKQLAAQRHDKAYRLSISRLSQYEAQGVIPNIYAMYSLSKVYRRPFRELMRWYGVPL